MPTFNDLDAFRAAIDLMVAVYRITESFPQHERYGLTAQMRRASVSVVSHIAEGQGRLTPGEWRQMLSHARGSLYEVRAQCIAAEKLSYLSDNAYVTLQEACAATGRPLAGLIRYVRRLEAKKYPTRAKLQRTTNYQPPTTATAPSPSKPSP